MKRELGPGKDRVVMKLLKEMGREEILEILSSAEFCQHCEDELESRIHKLVDEKGKKTPPVSNGGGEFSSESGSPHASCLTSSESIWKSVNLKSRMQEEHKGQDTADRSSASVKRREISVDHSGSGTLLSNGVGGTSPAANNDLSEEEKERTRLAKVGRKKDFVHMERINGKSTNILQGLELHTEVFNAEEQKAIVECVYNLQRMGQKGLLKERTFSEPRKWMRGKGRVTIQFGCCYNYSADRKGNPPGIIRDEEVDPVPPLLKQMIKRMVRWHVLPPTCIPNSCIVNIYEEGDCIPPHIDHHDFLRPFCTVSFLSECNILFGSNLKVVDAGDFSGPVSIPLPRGSVLILNGNGADVAKHCVPGVPAKRISITFRKMDDSKLPYRFLPDPELQGIKPIVCSPMMKVPHQPNQHHQPLTLHSPATAPTQQSNYQNGKSSQNNSQNGSARNTSFLIHKDEFPPLGSSNSSSRRRAK